MKFLSSGAAILICFAAMRSIVPAEAADEKTVLLQQSLRELSREHALNPPLTIDRCMSIIGQSEIMILPDDSQRLLSICESAGMLISPNFFTYHPGPLSPNELTEDDLLDFFDFRTWWNV